MLIAVELLNPESFADILQIGIGRFSAFKPTIAENHSYMYNKNTTAVVILQDDFI